MPMRWPFGTVDGCKIVLEETPRTAKSNAQRLLQRTSQTFMLHHNESQCHFLAVHLTFAAFTFLKLSNTAPMQD